MYFHFLRYAPLAVPTTETDETYGLYKSSGLVVDSSIIMEEELRIYFQAGLEDYCIFRVN